MTTYARKKEAFVERNGKLGNALLLHFTGNVFKANDSLQFNYIGIFKNLEDFAEQYVQNNYKIPNEVKGCIDWSKVAKKILAAHPYFSIDLTDGTHVFWDMDVEV